MSPQGVQSARRRLVGRSSRPAQGTASSGAVKPLPTIPNAVDQQFRSAATTDLSITPATTPQDGDIIILAIFCQSDTDVISTPSDFVEIDTASIVNTGGDLRAYLFMKLANGESGPYTCGKTGTEGSTLSLLVTVRGAEYPPTDTVTINASTGGARTNAVLPAVTTTVGSSILLYICGFRGPGYSATPATGYTELIDTTSINPPNAEVAVKAQWAPTTTSAGTITKSGASTDIVYHIPLSPA